MDFKKQAFILEVIKYLQLNRSSAGRNNVQKALFFANETASFRVPFYFQLQRQSPYSSDLEQELVFMKASEALVSRPTGVYGEEFLSGNSASIVTGRSPLTAPEKACIASACEFVGRKSVEELERIAAVVWVRSRERVWDRSQVAARVHELKPHIPVVDAQAADGLVMSSLKLLRK
jgi:hypothetical protein